MFASGLYLLECNSDDTTSSAVCCLIQVGFWFAEIGENEGPKSFKTSLHNT